MRLAARNLIAAPKFHVPHSNLHYDCIVPQSGPKGKGAMQGLVGPVTVGQAPVTAWSMGLGGSRWKRAGGCPFGVYPHFAPRPYAAIRACPPLTRLRVYPLCSNFQKGFPKKKISLKTQKVKSEGGESHTIPRR